MMRLSRSIVTEKRFCCDWCNHSLAAASDTSIKYIEEHYFHYRAELSTQTLAKGRNTLKAAIGDLEWLQIRPVEKQT